MIRWGTQPNHEFKKSDDQTAEQQLTSKEILSLLYFGLDS